MDSKSSIIIPDSNNVKCMFALRCESGTWDDYVWWLGGIYDNIESAEKAKSVLDIEAKRIRDNCPHPDKNSDDMTDEEEHDILRYEIEHRLMFNYTKTTIFPISVNTPLDVYDMKPQI